LRNHGLVTLGATVSEAFILMLNLERACRVQMAIQASGQPIHPVSEEVCELTARQYEGGDSSRDRDGRDPNAREWRAMLQRIEPLPATSYRD
jgi:ribulose-5-phosphate 4-epimerase/fuculose-1-phosphate aldolase